MGDGGLFRVRVENSLSRFSENNDILNYTSKLLHIIFYFPY